MKLWKVALIVGVIVALAVSAGVAFAQSDDPPPGEGEFPRKFWNSDDRTTGGRPRTPLDASPRSPRDDGPLFDGDPLELHDLMLSTLADELGLTQEALEAQLESEGGLMAVLLAQDLSFEDARTLLLEVRTETIQEALEQGLIDETQAERILEHLARLGSREGGERLEDFSPRGRGARRSACQDDS
ncbi:MAG TPA: hypothetical protein G4O08_02840 [Anaerolineae bacterium]|nr:hypothetical protein [Anaerolineae bacterium]